MNQEKLNKLMPSLLGISSLTIVIGAIFKLQHYPLGEFLFWAGIWTNFVLSTYEINRLRKLIQKSEDVSTSEETIF